MCSLTTLLLLALPVAQDGPGRGSDASDSGGIIIVVGIAVLGLLIAVAAVFLVSRFVRSRREADRHGRTARAPLPSEEGRPWSSER